MKTNTQSQSASQLTTTDGVFYTTIHQVVYVACSLLTNQTYLQKPLGFLIIDPLAEDPALSSTYTACRDGDGAEETRADSSPVRLPGDQISLKNAYFIEQLN